MERGPHEDSAIVSYERMTAQPTKLFNNFMWMSVCFSINHATVTAMIALATSSLGPTLGNAQTATLYGFYTLTALFAANIIVSATGYKWGIVLGLSTYVLYVGSFIIADQVPSVKEPAAYIGGTLGGVAAGFLWSAQGPYFAKNAELYAEAAGKDKATIGATFAAYFAVPYLGCEVFFKLIQTSIGGTGPGTFDWSGGKNMIYVINTLCAVAAAIGCAFIMDMPQPADAKPVSASTVVEKTTAAVKLFVTDPKMPLMMGMNVAFGVVAAYVNGYLISPVGTRYLGAGYGGYLAAVTAGVAALLSVPTVLNLIQPSWKKYYMIFGPLCFGLVCFLPLTLGYGRLGNWGGIVTLFVLQGVGRGVWEATNKALFAEYFDYDTLGAFSNIIVQNGATSAIFFFLNAYGSARPSCPADATDDCAAYALEAWIGVVCSLLAVVGFLCASVLKSRGIKTWSDFGNNGPAGVSMMDDAEVGEVNQSSASYKPPKP